MFNKTMQEKRKQSGYYLNIPKNNNLKIVISEVYAFLVLQCTVSGR